MHWASLKSYTVACIFSIDDTQGQKDAVSEGREADEDPEVGSIGGLITTTFKIIYYYCEYGKCEFNPYKLLVMLGVSC